MSTESEDRDKIQDVLALYCTFVDNARFSEVASLFAEDGSWQGTLGSAKGRAEIEALMVKMNPPAGPVRRHLVTNVVIAINGDRANVQSTFILVRESENGPMIGAVGSYNDVLIRRGPNWLFAARKVTPEIIGEARLK
jgi:SnoaL-like domain